jgi:hypothetical protein
MDEEILNEELKGEGMLDEDKEKPTCRLDLNDKNPGDLIWSVADTLRSAGFGGKASEFTERASRCVNYDEVLKLASAYVKIA